MNPDSMPFRFGLRDVFWATLAIGLLLGWLIDRRNVAGENKSLQIKLQFTDCGMVLSEIESFLLDEGFDVRWEPGKFSIDSPNGSGITISDDRIPKSSR